MEIVWLNANEAAQYLRVKPRTILKWAKTGQIPAHPLSGSKRVTWRFLKSELDAMLIRRLLRDSGGSMSSRIRTGSIAQDKRSKVWNFFWWENGKRKCKALGRFPTKAAAWKAAKPLRDALEVKPKHNAGVPTVSTLLEQYKAEKMPRRKDTHRTYESWMRLHISPKWGQSLITDLQARPVELWLESLALAPKSRAHIREILSSLWNFAIWKQSIPMQVNPISLVTVKGASGKRVRQPRSLTVEQFRLLLRHLHEPHGTIALMCICFCFRISECLALRWSELIGLTGGSV